MNKDFPTIKTNRLLLRQFVESDLTNVFNGLSHTDVIKYYGVSYHSLEDTKKQISWFKELEENETGIWWAVCSPDNESFYGAVGLNNVSKEHKKAETGFWLMPEFWHNGFISECFPFVLKFGFDQLNLHRIEAQVEAENSNSRRVLEKSGFKKEGTMIECEIKNGRYISLDIYALLNPGYS